MGPSEPCVPVSAKRRLDAHPAGRRGTRVAQDVWGRAVGPAREAACRGLGDAFISTQYILDCVERNEKLLELEAYRLGPARGRPGPVRRRLAVQARRAARRGGGA